MVHLIVQIGDAQGNFVPNAGNRVIFDSTATPGFVTVIDSMPGLAEALVTFEAR